MTQLNATTMDDSIVDVSGSLAPQSLNDLLAAAFRLHLADRPADAEALYRIILASPSPHAAASYGLGLLCYTRGHFNEAAEAYRRTIAIRGDDADAIINLGTTLLALGQTDEAVAQYSRAIMVRPDFALAHANLGKALQDRGQLAEAIVAYTRAVTLDPTSNMAHANLGGALLEQDMFAESAAMSQRAIELKPDMAMAHANMGAAMFRLGLFEGSLAACRLAVNLHPPEAMIHATLGGVLLELGEFQESAAACQRAIAINPAIAMAHFNLAHAYKAVNRVVEAEAACRQAVTLDRDCADYHFLLGHLLLLQGNFVPGWEEYEWRRRLPDFSWLRDFQAEVEQPEWKGEDIGGKTIFLLTEQGLGDIILATRYAPLLAERGARVIIAAHEPMQRLLSLLPSVTVVSISEKPRPEFDVYCPLLSLPRLCGTPPSAIFPEIDYLRADPTSRIAWRQRHVPTGLRVGLVWGGNPHTKYDRFRSPGLEPMRPLFDVPGVTFFILQVGPARKDIAATPLPSNVVDLGAEIDDLATTAAIMSEMDLVVSSCTAPLHLAGALGVATWAVLPFAPYFPWLLDRSDSPWYPSTRLYRQERPGRDWTRVIARVWYDLARFAETRAGPVDITATSVQH